MVGRGPEVLVVGAGMGGLSAALLLANRGCGVTVLERTGVPGGKARTVEVAGRQVAWGPTVLTMRWVFDQLFADTGASLDDYAALEAAEVIARHLWSDGTVLDLYADEARSTAAIEAAFGGSEARRYRAFREHTRQIWQASRGPFVLSQRPSLAGLMRSMSSLGIAALGRVDAHRTMWRALCASFSEPRLRQLFARYATYVGGSPFEAPATLNLIAHVESEGVHRVRGGIAALAAAMERRAREQGARFRYGAQVAQVLVRGNRATGVRLADGDQLQADAVVINADAAAIARGLLGREAVRAVRAVRDADRSLSAVTTAMVADVAGAALSHHTVLFSDDYPTEFDDLLNRRRVPSAPTVYLCAQDRADGPGPGVDERLLVIVNAPPTGDEAARWTEVERRRCETSTWETMRRCGLELTIRQSVTTTPVELEQAFPGTGGALYGMRPRGALSSLSREGARTKIGGLYLAGGSVHPGAGVPMAALSGRLAAESVWADLRSTASSRPADTSGITSMR